MAKLRIPIQPGQGRPTRKAVPPRPLPEIKPAWFWGIAVLLSLLVHGAIFAWMAGKPLGYVNPDAYAEPEQRFYSFRTYDELPAVLDEGDEAGEDQSKLADLSRELLNAPEESKTDWLETVRPRELQSDAGPSDVPTQAFDDRPATDEVIGELSNLGNLGFHLAGQGNGLGEGNGQAGNGANGSGEAGDLLAKAGLSRAIKRPPVEARVESSRPVGDVRPATDQGLADVDLAGLDLALGDAVSIPTSLDHAFDYRIRRYQPAANGPGFFEIQISAKRSLRQLSTMPKDVVFLVDMSGSIKQRWAESIQTGVNDALATLGPKDRFNIVFFSDKPRFFAAKRIVDATEENLAEAQRFLKRGKSDGYTDLNLALSRLLVPDVSTERAYNLIFISDGQPTRGVMDTRELINLITKDNARVTGIYAVGVGDKQNHELLDFLSYRNKGFSVYAEKDDEAAGVIRALASQLRYPVLKDVSVQINGEGISDAVPMHLPNIHHGEAFTVYARFTKPGRFTMHLSGRNGESRYDVTLDRDLADAEQGNQTVTRRWAFAKMHQLYSDMLSLEGAEKAKVQRAIEQLKQIYGLGQLEP